MRIFEMTKVFIDGSAGTTGLRIHERLADRKDLELIILPDVIRKDINARKDAINRADIAFLCLPDAAAIEAVSLVENPATAIIDTSTAHRTLDAWTYGFPELFDTDVFEAIDLKVCVEKRISEGGTGFDSVSEQIAYVKGFLK
jgi:N-acetyl-gamma-glutamylphosphate reductase